MGFADRTNYTAHQKSVHGNDKPFGCPQCQRSFSRRSDLRKHTVVHTGIKPFTCNICFKSFSRNTNLTKHLRIHSGHKPYVCPQCPKTFISKGDLTRHAIIHSGQRPFTCGYCDQSFGRRDKLMRHEKRHFTVADSGEEALRQLDAGLWNYDDIPAIANDDTVVIKEEIVDGEEPEEPEDYEGRDNWNGESMVINVDPFGHSSETVVPSAASVTSIDQPGHLPRVPEHITADSTLETHSPSRMQQTILPKRYPCLICHKRFSSADILRQHSRIHAGESRPFSCHMCTKSFLRKRELDRHLATHTGMKPFQCSSCDKRFGRKDKLVRHMRIHEQTSMHQCTTCGASFTRKDGLITHIKTHEMQSM